MIEIRYFPVNPFQMNSYLLWDETKEAIIIDAGFFNAAEETLLLDAIKTEDLHLVASYHTHCHIDHLLGDAFIEREYGLRPLIHKAGEFLIQWSKERSFMFGISDFQIVEPVAYIEEGEEVTFGNSVLQLLHCPGHADGSICFYSIDQGFIIVGDVLFNQGVGRTDLPGGDFDLLSEQIRTKLYTLPDEVVVYPGHGPSTTIGFEKQSNPVIRA